MKKVLIIVLLFFTITAYTQDTNSKPYYAFYPSAKGFDYKEFKHNIFGFNITIPSNWTFGVSGSFPEQVVVIYPEGLNTSQISGEFEMIEIGNIPVTDINPQEAISLVLSGMYLHHNDLKIDKDKYILEINGFQAISSTFSWKSKNGNTIMEYITLISTSIGYRSVTIRVTEPLYIEKRRIWIHSFGEF